MDSEASIDIVFALGAIALIPSLISGKHLTTQGHTYLLLK